MKEYNHTEIEKKWQKEWTDRKIFEAKENSEHNSAKPKWYSLMEFPYPSGDGLHTGHVRGFTAMDIISRKRRMENFNVLYPIGWDAFGLPTENYAIKTGLQPEFITKQNTDNYRKQFKSLGMSFDWSREINTSDPKYYKWTQWLFLKFLEHDLAYKAKSLINWCPKDKIGLANEEVVQGKCERCGTVVEKREKEQWMLRITKYAERLDTDLDTVDYWEKIKLQQRNWIGKSEGAEIDFPLRFENTNTPKPNYLILHGFTGRSDKNFIPWLKKSLEEKGFEVQAPQLPDTDHPTEAGQVGYVIENCKINKQTIIIGHSLGGLVAMKALQKINKPIAGLVLVAPAMEPKYSKRDSKAFWTTFSWDIDYEKLKKLTNFCLVLSDTQEEQRKKYLDYLADKLNAPLKEAKAKREHFCAVQEPFILQNLVAHVSVFTTRSDTIFGATYIVLSPEHPWVTLAIDDNHKGVLDNQEEVREYVLKAKAKTEIERTDEKTGVELRGIKAINPANKEEIPVFVADYVLSTYGTGAVMAVPAHDERDFEFAQKYNLPIREVVAPVLTRTTGTDAVRPNAKWIERDAVMCIVKHWDKDEYLVLQWNEFPEVRSFISGGVEENENPVEAGLREILEESGYKNARFVRQIGAVNYVEFYHQVKKVNRRAKFTYLFFELNDGELQEIAGEERKIHTVNWKPKEEVLNFVSNLEKESIWNAFLSGEKPYTGEGLLINSNSFDKLKSEDAKKEITEFVKGKCVTKFKLRDWVFSRQRYWGEPIPVIFCGKCGVVPVPEKDLPVELPKVEKYQPLDSGESPLAAVTDWVNTTCPKCGGKAKRETDTMPNWAGSSWYFLRYADPHDEKSFADSKKLKYWMPVDWYNGGMEHTTLHLLYSRFWNKFLFDIGLVPTSEPYQKRTSHGLILAKGGEKMSKSKGNVVNPDDIVKTFGADTLRMYEMFMGPFDQAIAWGEENILGVRRFLEKIWKLQSKIGNSDSKIETLLHKTIKKVSDDIETMSFNTAVSAMMILANEMEKQEKISQDDFENFLKILSPFAPHIAEEIWQSLGNKNLIAEENWPKYDPEKLKESQVKIVVQVDSRVRANFTANPGASEEEITLKAKSLPELQKWLSGKEIKRAIYIQDKLINFVVS